MKAANTDIAKIQYYRPFPNIKLIKLVQYRKIFLPQIIKCNGTHLLNLPTQVSDLVKILSHQIFCAVQYMHNIIIFS